MKDTYRRLLVEMRYFSTIMRLQPFILLGIGERYYGWYYVHLISSKSENFCFEGLLHVVMASGKRYGDSASLGMILFRITAVTLQTRNSYDIHQNVRS